MSLYPCKDCTERSIGCHGSCEKYKTTKERLGGTDEQIMKRVHLNTDIAELTFASMRRNKAKRYDRKW